MKNEIFQRIYQLKRGFTKQGNPFVTKVRAGLLVAISTPEGIRIGASSLHPDDVYDEKVAFATARKNSSLTVDRSKVPTRCRKELKRFIDRANRYFLNPKNS